MTLTMRKSGRRKRVSTKVKHYMDKVTNKLHRKSQEYSDIPPGFALSSDSQIQLLLESDPRVTRRRPPSLHLFDENDTIRTTKHVYYKTFTPPEGCKIGKRPGSLFVTTLNEMF